MNNELVLKPPRKIHPSFVAEPDRPDPAIHASSSLARVAWIPGTSAGMNDTGVLHYLNEPEH
jgi:hypothetical protein